MPDPAASRPDLSPVPLMQLSTGFWAFKTLAAADELDLFTRLSGTAGITREELAQALGIHPRPAEMLLTGCAALDQARWAIEVYAWCFEGLERAPETGGPA